MREKRRNHAHESEEWRLGEPTAAGCVRAGRPCRLLVVPAPVSERSTILMEPTRVDQQSFAGVVEPAVSPGCAAVLAGTSALRPARVFPPCRTTGLGHAPLRPDSPLRSASRPSPPPPASRRQSPAVEVHRVLRQVGHVRASILHPRDLRRRPCGCCHSSFVAPTNSTAARMRLGYDTVAGSGGSKLAGNYVLERR